MDADAVISVSIVFSRQYGSPKRQGYDSQIAYTSGGRPASMPILVSNLSENLFLRPMSHLRFYRAILSHECATLSRDKVTDAATFELHVATLSRKQTRLLHRFSRFKILLHKHSSKMAKLFYICSIIVLICS